MATSVVSRELVAPSGPTGLEYVGNPRADMTGGSADDGDGTRAELSERDWKNQVLQRAMARIGAGKSPRGSKPPFGSKQSPRSAFTTRHNVDVLSPQEDHLSMPCTTVDAHVGFVKQPQQPGVPDGSTAAHKPDVAASAVLEARFDPDSDEHRKKLHDYVSNHNLYSDQSLDNTEHGLERPAFKTISDVQPHLLTDVASGLDTDKVQEETVSRTASLLSQASQVLTQAGKSVSKHSHAHWNVQPTVKKAKKTQEEMAEEAMAALEASRVQATSKTQQKKGWFKKRGQPPFPDFKTRFFVLQGTEVRYFASEDDYEEHAEPKGHFSCIGLEVAKDSGHSRDGFRFIVYVNDPDKVGGKKKEIECACSTEAERAEWVAAFEMAATISVKPDIPAVTPASSSSFPRASSFQRAGSGRKGRKEARKDKGGPKETKGITPFEHNQHDMLPQDDVPPTQSSAVDVVVVDDSNRDVAQDEGSTQSKTFQSSLKSGATPADAKAKAKNLKFSQDEKQHDETLKSGDVKSGDEESFDMEGMDEDVESMGPVDGVLTVTIHKATGLPKMDAWTGKADPYVKIKVDSVTQRTTVKKRTLMPQWEEQFVFDCVAGESRLRLEVFHNDAGFAFQRVRDCVQSNVSCPIPCPLFSLPPLTINLLHAYRPPVVVTTTKTAAWAQSRLKSQRTWMGKRP